MDTGTLYTTNDIQTIIEAVVTNNLGYDPDTNRSKESDYPSLERWQLETHNLLQHLYLMDEIRRVLPLWDETHKKLPLFNRTEVAVLHYGK